MTDKDKERKNGQEKERRKKGKMRNIGECSSGEGNHKKNFQIKKTNRLPSDLFTAGTRRVFLWISKKRKTSTASLTVEAAIVVPLAVFMIAALLSVFDFYRIQSQVRTSIHESAMKLAAYGFVPEGKEESLLKDGFCILYGKKNLPRLGDHVQVSFAGTSCRNGRIHMQVHLSYRLPVQVIPVPPLRADEGCSVKIWDGWDGEEDEGEGEGEKAEEMVYIADNESVYHTSAFCTYLDLAIYQELRENMDDKRNCYGERYHPCEKCGGGGQDMVVYYSEKGTKYHGNAQCSGIKRNIHLVKKSQTEHLKMCERCRERMGK